MHHFVNLCFRYAQFYSQDEFCHYNMFNHHFFGGKVLYNLRPLSFPQTCSIFVKAWSPLRRPAQSCSLSSKRAIERRLWWWPTRRLVVWSSLWPTAFHWSHRRGRNCRGTVSITVHIHYDVLESQSQLLLYIFFILLYILIFIYMYMYKYTNTYKCTYVCVNI